MKTLNSISGGKTSAYLAAHHPADYNVFALVRIEDKNCAPKDPILKKEAEERTGKSFIATAEEDETMYAVLDLEQHIGQKIHWVTGPTFDWVIENRDGWLPNKLHRYCTTSMKIEPIFYWWAETIGEPVKQRFGYRVNEVSRAKKMLERCNENGLVEQKATFEKWEEGPHKGKNRWEAVPWFAPEFPLVENGVLKWEIENYWEGKDVRFARLNNCAGCFHRNKVLLRKQWDRHPEKMEWFASKERVEGNGTWLNGPSYDEVKEMQLSLELDLFAEVFGTDLESCDSGYCGM